MARRSSTLYVRNLDFSSRQEDVETLFNRYGRVREVVMPMDYYSRSPKGFAFVQFDDLRDAEEALNSLDKTKFMGKEIEVEFARGDRKTPSEMIAKQRGGRSESRRFEPRGRPRVHDDGFRRRDSNDTFRRFESRERRERYEPRDRSPLPPRNDRYDRERDRDRAPKERDRNSEDREDRPPARDFDRAPPASRDRDERVRRERRTSIVEDEERIDSRGRERRY